MGGIKINLKILLTRHELCIMVKWVQRNEYIIRNINGQKKSLVSENWHKTTAVTCLVEWIMLTIIEQIRSPICKKKKIRGDLWFKDLHFKIMHWMLVESKLSIKWIVVFRWLHCRATPAVCSENRAVGEQAVKRVFVLTCPELELSCAVTSLMI